MSAPVVLLLQADADSREMYADYLRHHGWRPVLVSTAREALTLAPRVDAVVTGLLLGGDMDGFELIVRLKRDERTRRVPLLVVTSCAWNAQRERAERAGCDAFLPKPCLPDELMREVRRLIDRAATPGS